MMVFIAYRDELEGGHKNVTFLPQYRLDILVSAGLKLNSGGINR